MYVFPLMLVLPYQGAFTLVLGHLLHKQVDALLQVSARRPQRGKGRAGYAICNTLILLKIWLY
jgi:hypothetical protein